MKLFCTVFVLSVVAALATASNDSNDSTNLDDRVTHDTLAREKRSIGVDENFKKDVEIKTKSGTSIKISKSISYNDGGAVVHLPMLLDSLGTNKVRVLQQLQNNPGGVHGVGQVGAEASVIDSGIVTGGHQIGASQIVVVGGAQIPSAGVIGQIGAGHHKNRQSRLHGLVELIHYKHAMRKQKLRNALQQHHGQVGVVSTGHHGLLAGHGNLGSGLKSLIAAKQALLVGKVSRKMVALSANTPIGPPCCPTGPCCPGNQGR